MPGSGKSTLAAVLSENGKYPVLSADMYFEDHHGNYNWNSELLGEAHTWCKSQCSLLMEGEQEFIFYPSKPITFHFNSKIFVANTFTQEWEMAPYFELAEKYGYTVTTIITENRHGHNNIHDVSPETLQSMKSRFQIKL